MASIVVGLCKFPVPGFGFSLPGLPSFSLPILILDLSLNLSCPLN